MTTTATVTTTSTARAMGITDEVTVCDHCGKSDLKSTVRMVWVDETGDETGEQFMGSVCAARMTGRKATEITTEAKRADRARERAIMDAWQAWRDADSAAQYARREAVLGRDYRFADFRAWRDSDTERAAQAEWDAAHPEPERPAAYRR